MASKKPLNYQKLNGELDEILNRLQGGKLDIDEASKQYERGMKIVEVLQTYLKGAQNKVTKIKKSFE